MSKRSSQSGTILLLGIMLILFMLCLALLLVDLLRVERSARTLQLMADAASLGGAVQLIPQVAPAPPPDDPRLIGWLRAKRAAAAFISNNSIYGDVTHDLTNFPAFMNPVAGCNDPYETNALSSYKASQYSSKNSSKNFNVTIERGIFTGQSFYSLECCANSNVSCTPNRITCKNGVPGCGVGAEVYTVANAVHVSIKLNSLNTYFGKILNLMHLGSVSKFSNIQRDAVGAPDT